MNKRMAGAILVIVFLISNMKVDVFAMDIPDELKNLYARSAVLMDADSGRVLFGKNDEDVLPMASTTKIMTCILALENMKTNQKCIVSEYASRQPKVHLGVQSGDEFYLNDLLYSLMLESHNDSAVIIAETIGGSVEDFAEMMNQKAARIGCENTYFISPNGLDAKDERGVHSTTAKELALIMRYCIQESEKNKEFLEITRTQSYTFTNVSGTRKYSCSNHNAFLGMMDGALSGKTGFTNDAGYCYVGALKQDERTFIVVLLACGWPGNKGYKWKDTRKLMQYALDNYEYQDIYEENETDPVLVKDGYDKEKPFAGEIYVQTKIVKNQEVSNFLLHRLEKIETKTVCQSSINAPVKEGVQVGSIYYMLNDEIIRMDKIVTTESVFKRNLKDCFEIILGRMLLKDLTRRGQSYKIKNNSRNSFSENMQNLLSAKSHFLVDN